MKFHLVYRGDLGSSGNSSSKPGSVVAIRSALSPQLEHLWATHNSLKVLSHVGVVKRPEAAGIHRVAHGLSPRDMAAALPHEYEYLANPLAVGKRYYTPLVRESLSTTCELNILFLRQQDPGQLVMQGGDIDNRIKTLLDALRMPRKEEQDKTPPTTEGNHQFCLMESDSLVSDLSVRTDRLLFPESGGHHEVCLVIEVTVNVLQVGPHNMCLV